MRATTMTVVNGYQSAVCGQQAASVGQKGGSNSSDPPAYGPVMSTTGGARLDPQLWTSHGTSTRAAHYGTRRILYGMHYNTNTNPT